MVAASKSTPTDHVQVIIYAGHAGPTSASIDDHPTDLTSSTLPMSSSSSGATLYQLGDGSDKEDPIPPVMERPSAIPESSSNVLAPSSDRNGLSHSTSSTNVTNDITRVQSLTSTHHDKYTNHRTKTRRHTLTSSPPRSGGIHTLPPPPPPVPDIISFFDPASAGGGGPLRRIETARSERHEAEQLARAREAEHSIEGDQVGGREDAQRLGGILKRFRSTSGTARRRPTFNPPILPSHLNGSENEEDDEGEGEDAEIEVQSRYVLGKGADALDLVFGTAERCLDLSVDGQKTDETDYAHSGDSTKDEEQQGAEEGEEEDLHVYPDGGYGWVVLMCCATLSACTMGWGMNFGVFQEYYAANVYPGANTSILSLGGTLCAFMMNATAFLSGRYGDRYGFKPALLIGAIIAWLGLFLAGWSTKMWQMILTQGLITGIGQGITMPLFMSLPSQWFYKRRGLASGIAIGGAGIGGGTSSLVVRQLLTAVGHRKTLWIMSFINLFFSLISILLIRTRPTSPEARTAGKGPWIDMTVVGTSAFWSLVLGMFVAVIGYALPFNFLAQWTQLNLPELPTLLLALPVTLLGFTVCIGRALVGFVADKLGPMNTFVLCFFLSGVIQLALWLTAKSLAGICVFGVMFGLVAPGYVGIIPQNVVQLFGQANLATNVGLLLLANGPGNFISGPLGGALFDASGGTSFNKVIIMSGCLQMGGALIICWARYKASAKIFAKI
ncbi:hypothetical protein IAR55_006528 [Kwoniella newhampshirensis]|uniref:Major facilitator superfamily (MFS) profile domain-containing protein n=1 Tax=Kwoniella newhampshirensis TaxID=1651941 RepID=A0AAW0YU69_9TREE